MFQSLSVIAMMLIMGDLNARVGNNVDSWHGVVGRHGSDVCNANGQRLLDFCAFNDLGSPHGPGGPDVAKGSSLICPFCVCV